MRLEDVNARKAYIESVRKSFDSPKRQYEFEKETNTKEEETDGFPYFKVRLFIAALLFAAYIFCDRTNTKIYHFTSEDISEEIAHDFDYNDAKDEVMQVFHTIMEK